MRHKSCTSRREFQGEGGWPETPWSHMCPAYFYLRKDCWRWGFLRDIQNHWAWTTPLLASKDAFWRHLKKPDTHFLCLAVSLICKVPLSICFISGMGKLMISWGSAERAHYWEVYLMLQLQQTGSAHLTNAWWDQPERQQNTVTTAFFTQQFDWTSCWICTWECTDEISTPHRVLNTSIAPDCGSTKVNSET